MPASSNRKCVYSLGLNLNTKFLSNSAGSGGSGRGDARYTAFSMDWRAAASPLHWVTRAPVTSPPGTCVTSTRQSRPTLAEGGLIQAALDSIAQPRDVAVAQRPGLDRAAMLLVGQLPAQFRLAVLARAIVRGALGVGDSAWPRPPASPPPPAWPRRPSAAAFASASRLACSAKSASAALRASAAFSRGGLLRRQPLFPRSPSQPPLLASATALLFGGFAAAAVGLLSSLGAASAAAASWPYPPPSAAAAASASSAALRLVGGSAPLACLPRHGRRFLGGARARRLLRGASSCARCAACRTCESTTTASMGSGCKLGGALWAEISAASTRAPTSSSVQQHGNGDSPTSVHARNPAFNPRRCRPRWLPCGPAGARDP